MGVPAPGGQGIIHVYAGGPALGPSGTAPRVTGAIDHVSITAVGYHDFTAHGMPFRGFIVPGTTLWQLFAYDPSGVQFELTFDARVEQGPPPDLSPGRQAVNLAPRFDDIRSGAAAAAVTRGCSPRCTRSHRPRGAGRSSSNSHRRQLAA